ncbi:MAG: TauD/TfdA family dioxygenase, partial [Proteobacteria bacterium]|nr:TauD/TfdA family dioxygenase [Pseudomonadota bacterium]
MNIRPISAPFGAEVSGVDLRQPLSDGARTSINYAFVANGVLVFRDQKFAGPDQFLAAASNLGDPMPPVVATYRLA